MKAPLIAATVSLLLSLTLTPVAMRILVKRGYGQLIRDDGPTSHHTKRGTPTMGGTVIILATLVGYGLAKLVTFHVPSVSALLVLFLMTGLGVVGFVDDFIKIVKHRSLGLRARAKLIGQSLVSIVFAVLAMRFRTPNLHITPASTHIPLLSSWAKEATANWHIVLAIAAAIVFILWIYVLIAALSNGVNLTDGLDGLATGASAMVFGAYVLIGVWQYEKDCGVIGVLNQPCYEVRDPLDLAIVASALMGSCFGFLWWNASPAKIFMGDTGSLALGGALAGLAICSRTELLIALLGGLFTIIALSVVIQVGSFKMTGKRVFRMAPLQHHFELMGWAEVTIVIRFWIVEGLCVALGLGVFYAGWVTGG